MQNMQLIELLQELALCKTRLNERTAQISITDVDSLQHDILLMEVEMLRMLITSLQELLDKRMKLRLTIKTRKAVFLIKPTVN